MALTWDLTEVIAREGIDLIWHIEENRPSGKTLNPVTDGIIWLTLILDQPLSEEKDVDEFFLRYQIHTQAFGSMFHNYTLTYEDVWRHRGLKTNVSRKTRAAFKTKVWNRLLTDSQTKANRSKAAFEQEAA